MLHLRRKGDAGHNEMWTRWRRAGPVMHGRRDGGGTGVGLQLHATWVPRVVASEVRSQADGVCRALGRSGWHGDSVGHQVHQLFKRSADHICRTGCGTSLKCGQAANREIAPFVCRWSVPTPPPPLSCRAGAACQHALAQATALALALALAGQRGGCQKDPPPPLSSPPPSLQGRQSPPPPRGGLSPSDGCPPWGGGGPLTTPKLPILV